MTISFALNKSHVLDEERDKKEHGCASWLFLRCDPYGVAASRKHVSILRPQTVLEQLVGYKLYKCQICHYCRLLISEFLN